MAHRSLLCFALLASTLLACTGTPRDAPGSAEAGPLDDAPSALSSPEVTPLDADAYVVWHDGDVMPAVKLYAIYWGSSVPYQSSYDAFWRSIVASPYVDWLNEYSTPTSPPETITRGTFAASVVDTSAPISSTIDNSQIQAELAALVTSGRVVADASGLYVFHFPAAVTKIRRFDNDYWTFPAQLCAYHDRVQVGGVTLKYAVVPYFPSGVCGGTLQYETMAASHELIEAITDPAAGGWWSPPGEIGDWCAWMLGTVNGWTVQLGWSNAWNGCIDSLCGNVDSTSDPKNCGSCGHVCASGACSNSKCVCPSGAVDCGDGVCRFLSVDEDNCGKCGNVCPDTATCSGGFCKCPSYGCF